jgi:hypothetical protein
MGGGGQIAGTKKHIITVVGSDNVFAQICYKQPLLHKRQNSISALMLQ